MRVLYTDCTSLYKVHFVVTSTGTKLFTARWGQNRGPHGGLHVCACVCVCALGTPGRQSGTRLWAVVGAPAVSRGLGGSRPWGASDAAGLGHGEHPGPRGPAGQTLGQSRPGGAAVLPGTLPGQGHGRPVPRPGSHASVGAGGRGQGQNDSKPSLDPAGQDGWAQTQGGRWGGLEEKGLERRMPLGTPDLPGDPRDMLSPSVTQAARGHGCSRSRSSYAPLCRGVPGPPPCPLPAHLPLRAPEGSAGQ